jgi:hypothetical protein
VRVIEVAPIKIVCEAFVSSPADLDTDDGPSMVTLPDDTVSPVTFGVAISNASSLPLVALVSAPALDNCPLPAEFTNGVSLAAGETRFWPSVCVAELQCGDVAVAVSVEAIVDTALTNVCAYDRDGVFVTASNSCEAIVRCASMAGCRVTGGGRQDATTSRSSFVFPRQGGIDCLSDLAVRYVTHGGQVGGRPMEFDPDSECIQGNWEHVRHAQGGRRAYFHARSFDSLMCVPPNKIAFSGVGDYACSKGGRKPRSVLFRVDIEGKARHSGRYRIRIWVLTAEELAALSGSANALNDPFLCNFRRAIAATGVNAPLTDGAVTAAGSPVPLGTAVFGVRPPDVDDGGEMLHGNHQIHPQTQECTAPVNICPVTP